MEEEKGKKKEWHFDFLINGITEDQADEIVAALLDAVIDRGGTLAGGFHNEEDPEDEHNV